MGHHQYVWESYRKQETCPYAGLFEITALSLLTGDALMSPLVRYLIRQKGKRQGRRAEPSGK